MIKTQAKYLTSQYKVWDQCSLPLPAPLSPKTMPSLSQMTCTSYQIPTSFFPPGRQPPIQCTQDLCHQHTKKMKMHKPTTTQVPLHQNQSINQNSYQREIGSITSKCLSPP